MRVSISFPDHKLLDDFIKTESLKTFTYPEVGATATTEKFAHYDNDNNHIVIGNGAEVWKKAKAALRNRHVYLIPALSIPWMYAVHGTLNAIGFALPAVFGWV